MCESEEIHSKFQSNFLCTSILFSKISIIDTKSCTEYFFFLKTISPHPYDPEYVVFKLKGTPILHMLYTTLN